MKQPIGHFLLRRLHEAGIRHIFGVPGDYNLEFMQQLEDRGDPAWIGTCNELNGSYAADGYARIRGLAVGFFGHNSLLHAGLSRRYPGESACPTNAESVQPFRQILRSRRLRGWQAPSPKTVRGIITKPI
ncbi:hypothetical protein SBA4_3150002 [Candidatus Sulfopaludibacter sp. SbA4]|nr:hypothetical protein SBA4_3150002 [Candidatus Sulfopaludibacter sp. SbA4]